VLFLEEMAALKARPSARRSSGSWFEELSHERSSRPAVHQSAAHPGDAFHFSQATRVGDIIWVSGQVGIDASTAPAKGAAAQARLAFEGLKSVLQAAGASLADVVELTTFHTELRGEMQAFAEVKDEYFPDRIRPGRRSA